MPNMEDLIPRISRKISERKEGEIWATILDFDYAYGQNNWTKIQKICIFTVTGGDFTGGYYRFLKGFYGLADIPTIFQERINTTLEHKHPAWLDDIIIVTKGSIDEHEMEVLETMKKLEQAGYRLNPKKCEFFEKEIEWVGHKIDQQGIRPLQDKLQAITKIKIPKKRKRMKIVLGSNTILIEVCRKFVSKHRRTEKTIEETKWMDLDRWTHKSIH